MSHFSSPQSSGGSLSYGMSAPEGTRSTSERPLGVTVLAVLCFIGAGLLLRSVYLLFYYPPQPGYGSSVAEERPVRMIPLVLAIALTLIAGTGLWRLRGWGKDVSLVMFGLVISVTMLAIASSRHLSGSAIATILLAGAAFYYLCRPEVGATFRE